MRRAPVAPILSVAAVGAVLTVLSVNHDRPPQLAADADALLAEGLYEQAESTARRRFDMLRAMRGDDSLQVAGAADALLRALTRNGRGADAQVLALAQQTLQTKETHLGPRHSDLVPSLLNLGEALSAAAEYQRAIVVVERAVALREQSGLGDRLLAEALDHLGTVLTGAGRYDDALAVLNRSLHIKETLVAPGSVTLARTLETIGLTLQRKGDYEQAAVPLRRAGALQQAANVDHPDYVETLNLLAQQGWFEGNLPESRDASEQAVALAERTLRADHPALARSLRYLAATVEELGDLGRALTLKRRMLAIAERNFGLRHPETGEYLHELAHAELYQGAYPTAREHFERALTVFEARFGAWHDWVATAHHNLALVDASLGDYASARRELGRAMAIWERALGHNHPFVAVALTELATVYREQGAPTESAPLLERALVIRERSLGPRHRDVARTLADLSSTLVQTGHTTRAQALAARALGIWDRLDAPDAPDYATVLALYAELQANRGDSAAARQYYERALAIRRKVFGGSHPAVADTQARLALALAGLGDVASAFGIALSAETTGREHLRLMLRSLPERQSLNYAASRPRGLDLMLSLIDSSPHAADAALDGLIRSRALVLDEMAARQAGWPAGENASPLRSALVSAQQRLANLVVRGPGQLTAAQYATVVDEARRDSELGERALVERSAEFRAEWNRAQLGLDAVVASLPPDSALISFVRYDRTRFGRSSGTPTFPVPGTVPARAVPSYLAFVLRSNQPPVAVVLGGARTIDPLVSRWRADIAAEASTHAERASDGAASPARASGAALRTLVWDPLTPHLSHTRRIFVVPDGALSLVPFVALPAGQRSYLLERAPVVHYLSAERDLVASSDKGASVGRGLLALGGPAFDDRTRFAATHAFSPLRADARRNPAGSIRGSGGPCADFRTVRFEPLTGTRQEVGELSNVWSTPSSSRAEPARVLLDRDASESAFKRQAPRQRVLHLATHGFFLSDACTSNAPVGTRAIGGLSTPTRRDHAASIDNPLLLSGLALAGANHRAWAAPEEDDGILTAEEVASLDLAGVEWAVLSACDTGLGEIKAGEGVFGLRRAFQIAGARTVIMSLWSVDDQSTRSWMRALYEGRLEKHLDTADAVHEASLAVLRSRRAAGQSPHPFYWAAFVAAGDWR